MQIIKFQPRGDVDMTPVSVVQQTKKNLACHWHSFFLSYTQFIWSPVPGTTLPLAEVAFSSFLCKIQPSVSIRIAKPSQGERQLRRASCLASEVKVTLASGTTFLQRNAFARLTGTALGVASVTKCLDLGFKIEIRIREVKFNSANPTVIE